MNQIKHRYENEQNINKIKKWSYINKRWKLKHLESTKFPHVYELARHRIALSEHWMSLRVYWLSCSMFNVQWNCFNLVYTCNIALILFLKCDVTKFRVPPPIVTLRRPPPRPLMCDVIYGWPLMPFSTEIQFQIR